MKKIFFIIISTIFLFSCSEDETPIARNLDGIWRIFIGNEYSLISKDIEIKFVDSIVSYDSLALKIQDKHNKRHIIARHDFELDSAFILDIEITYDNNRIVGNEIKEIGLTADTVYIYGEKIRELPEEEKNEDEEGEEGGGKDDEGGKDKEGESEK